MPRPTTAEQLATLTAIVQRMDQRAEEDRTERKADAKLAQESREKVQSEIQRHGQQIEGIEKRVAKVEGVAEMATSFRARFLGALFVLGLIGSFITLAATFFKDKLLAVLG